MNPLLALTAAKVGNNLLNNLAKNISGGQKTSPEAEIRKAEFNKMMIAAANTPKARAHRELSADNIGGRSDGSRNFSTSRSKSSSPRRLENRSTGSRRRLS